MSQPNALERGVITAYQGGLSYEGVARVKDMPAHRVQLIMHKFSPGSIRKSRRPFKPRPVEEGLTLAALGLYAVGPCADCETPLVSSTRWLDQVCGFCLIARNAG